MTEESAPDGPKNERAWSWARFQEPHFHAFYRAVHQRLKIGPGTRLLDVGCGPGGSALLAAEGGAQVAGLDLSPDAIEVARERVPSGDFRVGDAESLPWPDGSFDAVTGFNSFQFARSPAAALGEARRVLGRGGKLGMVFWAPPGESEQATLMRILSSLAPPQPAGGPGPFALSAPGVAEAALEAAGLRPIDGGTVPVVVAYADREAALGAMLAGSAGPRAIAQSGAERVRQVMLDALEEFRVPTGGYQFENRFRFLIAAPASLFPA